jgi:anti-sigma regulatory factor (Ser/Thr protein kinase)
LELATLPNAVAWARRHTVVSLQAWRTPADVIETARLVISELVTNAITNTMGELATLRPRDTRLSYAALEQANVQRIVLRLTRWPERLLIEVYDPNETQPRFSLPAVDAEHGRGLLLVANVAEQWGSYPIPGSGKVVWAKLAVGTSDTTAGPIEPAQPHIASMAVTTPMPPIRDSRTRAARPRQYVVQTAG